MSVPENSVIVRLKGGLGNQLFQYATARALAIETNRPLYIDTGWYEHKNRPRHYRLSEFQIQQKTVSYSKAQLRLLKVKSPLAQLKILHTPLVLSEPKDLSYRPFKKNWHGDILLEGYWQSHFYFANHRPTLLQDLQLASSVDNSTLITPSANTVAVHIRRGDYITSSSAHVVSEQYIKNAMAAFGSNYDFLFFSDDIAWCSKTFKGDRIAFSNQPSDLMDLMQMSLCHHNIIANSSFSWWSAWLNQHPNQRVIAPAPWTADGNSHRNILPDHWETLAIK